MHDILSLLQAWRCSIVSLQVDWCHALHRQRCMGPLSMSPGRLTRQHDAQGITVWRPQTGREAFVSVSIAVGSCDAILKHTKYMKGSIPVWSGS
jgi:hypothetical protein